MLAAAQVLLARGVRPEHDLLFAAVAQALARCRGDRQQRDRRAANPHGREPRDGIGLEMQPIQRTPGGQIASTDTSRLVGTGGERGGRRGCADEWADIPAMVRTAKHVLLLGVLPGERPPRG
jgi:hypothetical protein